MKKLIIKFSILILIAVSLTGCGEMGFNNWRWHQKMTIEVEVDGKIYKGSSVTSVHWWPNFFTGGRGLGYGSAWLSKIEGEAVVVELPGKKYLFGLLSYAGNEHYTANLATRVMANESKRRVWGEEAFQGVLSQKGKPPLAVQVENYPLFVTFKDIADPASVQKVNPYNLAEKFGEAVRLKNVLLEITDNSKSLSKVSKLLNWLKMYRENDFRLNGNKCVACPVKSEKLADLISGSEFKIGD